MGCSNPAAVTNGGGGACDLMAGGQHTCQTYTAMENACALGICGGQTACTDQGGKWLSACPSGMLGTCTSSPNSPSTTFYPSATLTAAQAQAACSGTWAAGK
jgi:hypothetical protein